MNNIIYRIHTALLLIVMVLSANVSHAQILKVELRATGLTCSMCSNAIQKQLQSIPQIDSVSTDLNTSTFTVYLKKGNTLTPNIFKEKVEKAGFSIGFLMVTALPDILNSKAYVHLNEAKINTTQIKFQILDKGYVTEKQFKKLCKTYKGIATYADTNENDFHVKMVNE